MTSTLMRSRDFLLLWAGQSISGVGSAVTFVALPLTAVVTLHASAWQIGLLSVAASTPLLLVALPAGLLADRTDQRRLLIGCDVGRMIAIGTIPAAYAFHVLSLAQMYAVAVLTGTLTVIFQVTYQSFVPEIVAAGQLHDANNRLASGEMIAQTGGPSLGGALFGLAAAGSMTADALSFAGSWLTILAIRRRPAARRPGPPGRMRAELLAGLRFLAGDPSLRMLAACTASANLFLTIANALQTVYLVRVLHISPAYTGLVLAAFGVGGISGGAAARPLGQQLGTARLIWVSMLSLGFAGLLVPLASPGWGLAALLVGYFSLGARVVLFSSGSLSFRQAVCPPELLGRLNAALRWLVAGALPLGGLLAGLIAAAGGVRAATWVGMGGTCAASFWLLASPLRRMRDMPAAPGREAPNHTSPAAAGQPAPQSAGSSPTHP